jgi:WD40 repeat protein
MVTAHKPGALGVTCLEISPDARTYVTSGVDYHMRFWDQRNHAELAPPIKTGMHLQALAYRPDGRVLATGSIFHGDDDKIILWDVYGRRRSARLRTDVSSWGIAFAPSGDVIAAGGSDGRIRLWRVPAQGSPAVFATFIGHEDVVVSVAFSPDGKTLASASLDRTVRLWDLTARSQIALFGHNGPVHSVVFSPDGGILASGGGDHTLRLWALD